MNRRNFLVGSMAGAAGFAALGLTGGAQAPAAGGQAPAAGGRQGAAAGRGRGFGAPANVPAEKLARISIMTLDFSQYRVAEQRHAGDPDPDDRQRVRFPKALRRVGTASTTSSSSWPTSATVGNRSELHQGDEGEARRVQDDDDPGQHGDRRRRGHDGRRRRAPEGPRPPQAVDRYRGPVWLQAPHAQPEPGRAHEGQAGRRRRLHEGRGRRRPAARHQDLGRDARRASGRTRPSSG